MNTLLQVLCTITAMITLWLLGDQKRIGFLVGTVAQLVWVAYFLYTGAYVMLITPVVYAAMYMRGWLKWKKYNQSTEKV